MSSDGNGGFGHAKWVVTIALGVVLGLVLWTVGNSILAEWQKTRREQEAAQNKAKADRERAEDAKRTHAWAEIIFDAQYGEKARNMIAGTAPLRRDGTLRSRIESSPEYKRRLRETGAVAMRKELLKELSIQKDATQSYLHTQMSLNSSRRGTIFSGYWTLRIF